MPVPAVILAAGASRRLGRPKQLVPYAGKTLLERAIRLATEAGTSPVIVVLGAYFDEISASLGEDSSIRVSNHHWENGIAGSIHAGLQALESNCPGSAGVLLMTCDQPRLTAGHLGALLQAFHAQHERSIAASAYADTLGIPSVFPRSVYAHLLALRGDQGARLLLAKPPCPMVEVPFPGGEIDIDLPGDLAHLEER